MTAEEKYKQQLVELGVWQDAFAPEVHTLCMMERELRRAQKEWRAGNGELGDKQHLTIQTMRRDILAHRDALGLTPKGLQRLRGKETPGDAPAVSSVQEAEGVFASLLEKVRDYG